MPNSIFWICTWRANWWITWELILAFLRSVHLVFHNGYITRIPPTTKRFPLSPHPHNTFHFRFFDYNHPNRYEVTLRSHLLFLRMTEIEDLLVSLCLFFFFWKYLLQSFAFCDTKLYKVHVFLKHPFLFGYIIFKCFLWFLRLLFHVIFSSLYRNLLIWCSLTVYFCFVVCAPKLIAQTRRFLHIFF